jgi:sigma-B regulation protein RsbU (phosphoserine phosphatase)
MPKVPGYEVAAHWESAREVAGDFYDVFPLEGSKLAVAIADVSDKGAPAALFMAVARTMIRTMAHSGISPLETLSRTNDLILEDADSGMFVTVYYSVFGPNGTSEHINAGHNPMIVYRRRDSQAVLMPTGGRAIGWFPHNPLKRVELEFQPGDVCVYYTDGITEAENAVGQYFGEDRLMKAVIRYADHAASDILLGIISEVSVFCGDVDPFDDQTLVVVRYTG